LRRVVVFWWRRGLGENELKACECYYTELSMASQR
jgi:hypothetical protein